MECNYINPDIIENMEIGKIIEKQRKKKKISRIKLAYGLCTQQLIYKLEVGECNTSILMFTILLERLGNSPDNLECIISKNEYRKIARKKEMEDYVLYSSHLTESERSNRKQVVLQLLEEYMNDIDANNHAEQMYYYRMKGYVLFRLGKMEDRPYALENIEKALEQTYPDWKLFNLQNTCLSIWELENLLAYIRIKSSIANDEEKESLTQYLLNLIEYVETGFTDRNMKSKILPKCIYVLGLLGGDNSSAELLDKCEQAIELLTSQCNLYMLSPLIGIVIKMYRKRGNDKNTEKWMKYYQCISELEKHYAPDMILDSVFFHYKQCEYQLDYEIIRAERTRMSLSQEYVAEGVFGNRASFSEMENGKITVNNSKFETIMKKLQFDKRRIDGFYIADDYEVFELGEKIRVNIAIGDIVNARMSYEQLRGMVDESFSVNERLVKAYDSLIQYFEEKDKNIKYDNTIYSLIMETFDLESDKYLRYPLRSEMDMILMWLGITRERKKAIDICEKLMTAAEKSEMLQIFHYRTYASVLWTYLLDLGILKLDKKVKSLYGEVIQYYIACGKGGGLSTIYWSLAISEDGDDCIGWYYKSYLFADIYREKFLQMKKRRYEEVMRKKRV